MAEQLDAAELNAHKVNVASPTLGPQDDDLGYEFALAVGPLALGFLAAGVLAFGRRKLGRILLTVLGGFGLLAFLPWFLDPRDSARPVYVTCGLLAAAIVVPLWLPASNAWFATAGRPAPGPGSAGGET